MSRKIKPHFPFVDGWFHSSMVREKAFNCGDAIRPNYLSFSDLCLFDSLPGSHLCLVKHRQNKQPTTHILHPGFVPIKSQETMKNFLRLSAALTVLFAAGAANTVSAQATATATATATIVTPISISKTTDMDFGNVAVHATDLGTVVLAPAGTRTATAGVTLPATAGTPAAAVFTVSGQGGYTYAITLPQTASTLEDLASNTMSVDTWTSVPSTTGTLSSSGTETLSIGATLHVAGGQAAGTYTTAQDFAVTVNYN